MQHIKCCRRTLIILLPTTTTTSLKKCTTCWTTITAHKGWTEAPTSLFGSALCRVKLLKSPCGPREYISHSDSTLVSFQTQRRPRLCVFSLSSFLFYFFLNMCKRPLVGLIATSHSQNMTPDLLSALKLGSVTRLDHHIAFIIRGAA